MLRVIDSYIASCKIVGDDRQAERSALYRCTVCGTFTRTCPVNCERPSLQARPELEATLRGVKLLPQ